MGAESRTAVTMTEFNREPSRVARAASRGPVIITDRGRPARVMMSYEEFERLKDAGNCDAKVRSVSLYDAFKALPDTAGIEIDFEADKHKDWGFKVWDLDD